MVEIDKIITMREVVLSPNSASPRPDPLCVRSVWASSTTHSPDGLSMIFSLVRGRSDARERLMPDLVKLLDGPAVSYGKGALIAVTNEVEHGGACVQADAGRDRRWQSGDILQR